MIFRKKLHGICTIHTGICCLAAEIIPNYETVSTQVFVSRIPVMILLIRDSYGGGFDFGVPVISDW